MQETQTTNTVLMIRPARFRSNPETAASNAFQQADPGHDIAGVQLLAEQEFEALAAALKEAGVNVLIYADTPSPDKPDAVFPNNWLSTHADGTVVLYPMQATNRRVERRPEILAGLAAENGFAVGSTIDLSGAEQRGQFLEGTGSMVLDRVHRIVYACISPRTHPDVLKGWCARFDYEPVTFSAISNGQPIYHTNVMMSIGSRIAVICLAAIESADEREMVRSRLESTGHRIIDITPAQMNAFAGNILELAGADGGSVFVMSQRAYDSLDDAQRAQIGSHSKIVSVPITTIEDHAGGGVRCMLAEIFLPRG
ncbi:MAG TPA: arginine deiminase-related protein [Gammaproteobacteria bacterium]|nr:arginine deiminase-related protein [Gammaproteobacteria bacterium]